MAKLKNETVFAENGSVASSKTYSIKVTNSEEFYFTFISYFKPMLRIKHIVDVHVLTKFCMLMEYDSTKVLLPTQRRKDICEELKIQTTHLSNSIKRLKVLGIMTGDGGIYEINPYLVWKGKTDTRDKLLREEGLEIKLKFGGKDVNEMPDSYNPFISGNKEFE